jgi:hypothetical protein
VKGACKFTVRAGDWPGSEAAIAQETQAPKPFRRQQQIFVVGGS